MRKALWISVVMIVVLVLSACGAAKPAAPAPAPRSGETFMLALPRMVVNLDTAGNPVIFGLNAGQLTGLLGPSAANFRVDPATVKTMTDANIQHVEMRQVGDALILLVNGKPMPHIGWTDQSLQQAMDVAAAFNVQNTDIYKKILPLVRRLGIDLVMRFPTQAGAAEIPLGNSDEAIKTSPTQDPPSAIAQFEIKFDDKGVPSIMGISGQDLAKIGLNVLPQVTPETLAQRLQNSNIQNMELRSKNDGMHVYVNGVELPSVVWDGELLKNTSAVYAQLKPNDPMLPIMNLLIPWLDKADVDILFHFPIAAGKEPIPAAMHP